MKPLMFDEGQEVLQFSLRNMRMPDMAAAQEAKHLGQIAVPGEKPWYPSMKPFSGFVGHPTSIATAFDILKCGTLMSTKGICGFGIYTFECKSPTREDDLRI